LFSVYAKAKQAGIAEIAYIIGTMKARADLAFSCSMVAFGGSLEGLFGISLLFS
jgi:hypothetical protein